MPRIEGLKKVAIFGSGPIVIGQACEFDYSGTQACKALMKEGLEVILINSNPATIMTDPEIATRVYVEPLKADYVRQILEKEKPDAIIPTLGGQTALNLALELDHLGVLKKLGIRMLGATPEVIRAAEDRGQFCKVLDSVGAKYPQSYLVRTLEEGISKSEELGLPIILRPNYTLGGGGGGIAYSLEEYKTKLAIALHESPTSEVLVEQSVLGWKEFELEVMRDASGTFVVICSIENFDPCGVHTGDSITVAPQQTLSDVAYQAMRDEAAKIVNAVGVQTGGANIQFAVDPSNGDRIVIEMNPRVSRSSALASKATGFPIAKIAALLAIGYRLNEIKNDITGTTPSCYEPALDYVVTKIPRFSFEKFSGAKDALSTQMKSVGEVMAIGRTFQESLQKAMVSLERFERGFIPVEYSEEKLSYPHSLRMLYVAQAFREGYTIDEVFELSQITPWFLEQIYELVEFEKTLKSGGELEANWVRKAKKLGFSDQALSELIGKPASEIRDFRWKNEIVPSFFQVDTCAGEFKSETPYFYSTYWGSQSQVAQNFKHNGKEKILILGSGPNRIGQGIEFDYSCVRSVREFRRLGYHTIMVNSNPETVSTDYDTSDELYFEPLTAESVLEILRATKPKGFVAQLGGQTPILLAPHLVRQGFHLLGSSLDAIDLAEDRSRFSKVCQELNFKIPKAGMAGDLLSAKKVADGIGYPVICRPSYVLGGRRMEIVEDENELVSYFERHKLIFSNEKPCLVDQFLDRALEVDVDIVRGKDWVVVGGILEHIEAAGVHSGDSMGVVPPQRLKDSVRDQIQEMSCQLAEKLNIIGFLNLQLAVRDDDVYVLEANPRSSRSVPFIAKATGVPIVDLGARAIAGLTKKQVHPEKFNWQKNEMISVKGVVFPFKKFPEADSILGPEMKSTGETMGRGKDYAEAMLKALVGSSVKLPLKGEIFLSLRDKDKPLLLPTIQKLHKLGYTFSATSGTATLLEENSIPCEITRKVHEGRPHCVDRVRSGGVAFVLNTTTGRRSIEASFGIRRSCIDYSVPCITESDAIEAFVIALEKARAMDFDVYPLPMPST